MSAPGGLQGCRGNAEPEKQHNVPKGDTGYRGEGRGLAFLFQSLGQDA